MMIFFFFLNHSRLDFNLGLLILMTPRNRDRNFRNAFVFKRNKFHTRFPYFISVALFVTNLQTKLAIYPAIQFFAVFPAFYISLYSSFIRDVIGC